MSRGARSVEYGACWSAGLISWLKTGGIFVTILVHTSHIFKCVITLYLSVCLPTFIHLLRYRSDA